MNHSFSKWYQITIVCCCLFCARLFFQWIFQVRSLSQLLVSDVICYCKSWIEGKVNLGFSVICFFGFLREWRRLVFYFWFIIIVYFGGSMEAPVTFLKSFFFDGGAWYFPQVIYIQWRRLILSSSPLFSMEAPGTFLKSFIFNGSAWYFPLVLYFQWRRLVLSSSPLFSMEAPDTFL